MSDVGDGADLLRLRPGGDPAGPWDAIEKYDLNVFGDLNLGLERASLTQHEDVEEWNYDQADFFASRASTTKKRGVKRKRKQGVQVILPSSPRV